MRIYEHKTTMAVTVGSTATTTLNIIGGLLRQVLVTANTATTVFRANLVDENGDNRVDWGFNTGQLNELGTAIPVVNRITLNITNVSPNDTFVIKMGIQE